MTAGQPVDVRRMAVFVGVCSAGANLAGAGTVFAYQTLLRVGTPSQLGGARGPSALLIGLFVGYLLCAGAVGIWRGYRICRPAFDPLGEGLSLTRAQRGAVLTLPWRFTALSLRFWIGAAAFFGTATAMYAAPADGIRTSLGIVIGGLTTCSLLFLLLERGLRPATAMALVGSEADEIVSFGQTGLVGRVLRRRAGIGPRFFLLWALGSGAPLVGIALSPAGVSVARRGQLIVMA
ncbi:MAG TPA: hypothetical protein VFA11_05900 [Acidimicrobiales bacterium]|nr:hypothetical protein [Acidimicrobiales bacterium]